MVVLVANLNSYMISWNRKNQSKNFFLGGVLKLKVIILKIDKSITALKIKTNEHKIK